MSLKHTRKLRRGNYWKPYKKAGEIFMRLLGPR